MNISSTTVKGFSWSALGKWGSQLINFLVLVIFARVLGPEAFGLLAMANVFVNIIYIFLDQGYNATIIQRKDICNEILDTAFWSNMLVGFLFTFFGVIFSSVIARLYSEPQLESIIRYLSMNFFILAVGGIQQALLRRNFKFKLLAISTLTSSFIGGSIGVYLALSGAGVWSLVIQIISSSVINVGIMWITSGWKPKLFFSWDYFLDLSKFGINIIGNRVLSFFDLQFDELLIGYSYGATSLGYYSIAKSIIVRLAGFISGATTTVTMSLFSKLQENKQQLLHTFYKVIEITALIVFPLFSGIMVISSELINIFFGPQWGISVPILMILAPTGIALSLLHYHENIIIAFGFPQNVFRVRLINSVIRVTIIVFILKLGLNHIAFAVLFSSLTLMYSLILLVKKIMGVRLGKYFRSIIYPTLSSMIMVLLVLLVKRIFFNIGFSILGTIFMICLSVGIYLGSITIFCPRMLNSLIGDLLQIIKVEEKIIIQN
ncbi:MAG: lipopolysaccharide biosynthesis protein [Anaerolineales bacterium]